MKEGTLIRWDDSKGFGFVQTADGELYFLHIRAVKRTAAGRPRDGDWVIFEPGRDAGGRLQVLSATVGAGMSKRNAGRMPATPPRSRSGRPAGKRRRFDLVDYACLPLLCLLPVMLYRSGTATQASVLALLASVFAMLLYWFDKQQAQAGRQRIPESWLHLLALLGGWPGAWLAQHLLRHKSSKFSFRVVFLLTAVVHLMVSGCWLPRVLAG